MSRNKKKILYFGGSGQIGSEFLKQAKNKYKILAPTHSSLDINNKSSVERYIYRNTPDQIIYSIGFTNIDQAPLDPLRAIQLNTFGIETVARIAAKKNIPVYYLSTEVVFDGFKSAAPYTEKDIPNPLSLNAKFKRLGELVTLNASPHNLVIRLIMCYSVYFAHKLDISRMVVKNLKQGKEFIATCDQEINPIYVNHLVSAIFLLIDNSAFGIYHVGAKNYTTPFKFAHTIARRIDLNDKLIKGIKFKEFSKTRHEPRPQHQWLDVTKFMKKFGNNSLFTIEEGIDKFIEDFKKLSR